MNSENNSEKQIVRVSSKKWAKENGNTSKGENNITGNGVGKGNIETEEEVIDPYTKKRRESLKNFAFDIAGKVSSLLLFKS